jgi:hypothetical protein
MTFAVPPNNACQREAFQKALTLERQILGNRIVALNSPREVAEYLEEIGFRPARPITEDTIKRWMRERGFPYVYVFGRRSTFLTTSAHVFAWFRTVGKPPPKKMSSQPVPL